MWLYLGLYALAMTFTTLLWVLILTAGKRQDEARKKHWTRK